MLWILFVMGAIAALVVSLIVGGLVTPRDHVVARSVFVPAAPAEIWQTVRDFSSYSEWRHDLEGADVVDTDQPQSRWRETTTRGSITFGVTVDEPPRRLTARILDDDLPFTGEWTWTIAPHESGTQSGTQSGTRLTITERGSVGNPVFRFVSAHFLGHTRSIDRYLRALAQHHGVRSAPIDDASPT